MNVLFFIGLISGMFLCLSQIKLRFKHLSCGSSPLPLPSCPFWFFSAVFHDRSEGPVWKMFSCCMWTEPLFILIYDFCSPALILVDRLGTWSRATSTPTIVFQPKVSPLEYSKSFSYHSCQVLGARSFEKLRYFVTLSDNSLLQMCAGNTPTHGLVFTVRIWLVCPYGVFM